MTTEPDSDWPPTFYFNGEELPEWTAFWHWCSLEGFTDGFQEDWDEFVGLRHLWQLQCRLDHVGTVESEDAVIFRICAQEVLIRLIGHQEQVLKSIEESSQGQPADEVYDGLTEGLARMIHRCGPETVVFWTSGGTKDLAALREIMRRCGLPGSHPEYMEAPHISQRRNEANSRVECQLSSLRKIAQTGNLDKRLRILVNQLPR